MQGYNFPSVLSSCHCTAPPRSSQSGTGTSRGGGHQFAPPRHCAQWKGSETQINNYSMDPTSRTRKSYVVQTHSDCTTTRSSSWSCSNALDLRQHKNSPAVQSAKHTKRRRHLEMCNSAKRNPTTRRSTHVCLNPATFVLGVLLHILINQLSAFSARTSWPSEMSRSGRTAACSMRQGDEPSSLREICGQRRQTHGTLRHCTFQVQSTATSNCGPTYT